MEAQRRFQPLRRQRERRRPTFTRRRKSRIVDGLAHETQSFKPIPPGGRMLARSLRRSFVAVALLVAATTALAPARAAEIYVPDPKLLEAATKEGEVVLYTTHRRPDRAAADQGVPRLRARRSSQVRAGRRPGAGGAADQRVARRPRPGRRMEHGGWRGGPAAGRHCGAVRGSERAWIAGGARRPRPALGRDQYRRALGGLQHASRAQGRCAEELPGPARPALEAQDRLEPKIHDRRLGSSRP